jgi:ABC-type glycerol-3-phosphate transport system substrate-binding protein
MGSISTRTGGAPSGAGVREETRRKGGRMKRCLLFVTVVIMAGVVAAGCGGNSSSASSSASPGTAKTTLTIWHNYGTEQNATALQNLAAAFEKLHPNVTIKIVSQPADNYFALLQAAAISKTGPDLAVMWTGLFTLQYKSFLVNLQGKVPAADLARVQPDALKWTSDGFNPANGPYVMPLETQFYIGFYNKAAFAKAGVTSVPTDWSQLLAACKKLKAAGYIPFTYGNGGQPLTATFYPYYDLSYMMIGNYPVDHWLGLYNGSIPWTASANQSQLAMWAQLHKLGYTNPDVITKTDNLGDFETGKAAMIMDGTWDTQKFTNALGSKVAAFVPPFTPTPVKGVVDFAGDGISAMTYSKNQAEDVAFLDFMTTPQAAAIINAAGLIPAIKGTTTTNPVNQQMLDFATKQNMTVYPMIDNVIQPSIVSVGNKELPSVLNGTISPKQALQAMQNALQQLPASQRGSSY